MEEIVHCKTQEEWDFVNNKLGRYSEELERWSTYKENSCKVLTRLGYANYVYYNAPNYIILSFEDWCKREGHNPNFLKLDDKGRPFKTFEVGKWYKNPKHSRCPKEGAMKISSIIDNRWYNSFVFDAIITNDGKIENNLHIDQSNSDYEHYMEEIDISVFQKEKSSFEIPDNLRDIEYLREHPQILEKLIEKSKSKSLDPFIKNRCSGFSWVDSVEKYDFWLEVLLQRNPQYFYTLYPKQEKLNSDSVLSFGCAIKAINDFRTKTLTPKIYTKPQQTKQFINFTLSKTKVYGKSK